jgi:hypothetical protein
MQLQSQGSLDAASQPRQGADGAAQAKISVSWTSSVFAKRGCLDAPQALLVEAESQGTREMLLSIGKSQPQFRAVRGASQADERLRCLVPRQCRGRELERTCECKNRGKDTVR